MIDVLAREHDGGYLVVDYKSDEVAEADELEELVARDYALQREVYALAVLRTGAPWVEVEHWFLARPREWASARFTAAERDALQASLQERLRRALRTGFAVTPRPHRDLCATCPGRTRLCSWPESVTMAVEPPPAATSDERPTPAEGAKSALSIGLGADDFPCLEGFSWPVSLLPFGLRLRCPTACATVHGRLARTPLAPAGMHGPKGALT